MYQIKVTIKNQLQAVGLNFTDKEAAKMLREKIGKAKRNRENIWLECADDFGCVLDIQTEDISSCFLVDVVGDIRGAGAIEIKHIDTKHKIQREYAARPQLVTRLDNDII